MPLRTDVRTDVRTHGSDIIGPAVFNLGPKKCVDCRTTVLDTVSDTAASDTEYINRTEYRYKYYKFHKKIKTKITILLLHNITTIQNTNTNLFFKIQSRF